MPSLAECRAWCGPAPLRANINRPQVRNERRFERTHITRSIPTTISYRRRLWVAREDVASARRQFRGRQAPINNAVAGIKLPTKHSAEERSATFTFTRGAFGAPTIHKSQPNIPSNPHFHIPAFPDFLSPSPPHPSSRAPEVPMNANPPPRTPPSRRFMVKTKRPLLRDHYQRFLI